jgi:hypothetical protein
VDQPVLAKWCAHCGQPITEGSLCASCEKNLKAKYELREYAIRDHYDDNSDNQVWQFEHTRRYSGEPGERGDIDMVHKTRVCVRYCNGVLLPNDGEPVNVAIGACYEVTLDADFVFPKRLGKKYVYGMDVSPGAKMNLRFVYTPVEEEGVIVAYRLKRVEKGVNIVDLDELAGDASLMQPIDLPFPVPDRIENEHGHFHIPFLIDNETEDRITFPCDIRKVV